MKEKYISQQQLFKWSIENLNVFPLAVFSQKKNVLPAGFVTGNESNDNRISHWCYCNLHFAAFIQRHCRSCKHDPHVQLSIDFNCYHFFRNAPKVQTGFGSSRNGTLSNFDKIQNGGEKEEIKINFSYRKITKWGNIKVLFDYSTCFAGWMARGQIISVLNIRADFKLHHVVIYRTFFCKKIILT